MRSITINHLNHHRLMKFAKATGKTLSAAAEEALNEWMETNGVPILKALERQEKKATADRPVGANGTGRLLVFPGEVPTAKAKPKVRNVPGRKKAGSAPKE